MQGNTGQENSEYGHFSRSDTRFRRNVQQDSMIIFFFFNKKYKGNPEEISKVETFKACQYIDIPTNVIKETVGTFANILSNFYDSVEKSNFVSSLKKLQT